MSRLPRRASLPWLIVAAGVLLTGVAAYQTRQSALANDRLRFQNAADAIAYEIGSRLSAYVAMLRGGAGLFAASDEVRLPEFRAYVERLELSERYPGIQGIGFSRFVRLHERERVAATLRAEGIAFRYWPDQPGRDVHAIVYLEPQDARNRLAIGYDMFSESVRREAMERARDTGAPAASGPVRLVQELIDPAHQQPGFLIYLPVYRSGAAPTSVEERRAQLFGFVYSPFRTHDLLRGILRANGTPEVTFEVYDGAPEEGRLLYASQQTGTGERLDVKMEVAGRVWTLLMRPGVGFRESARRAVLLVAGAGLLLTALLFVVTHTQVRAREAAERTADELRQSEEALRAANRAKDDFLAVISHELRTPLNAIMGWASMLRSGQVPPDQQPHALDVIRRNAGAQAMLVEDLLDISRAVAGRLRLELSSVPAKDVVKAAVDALRPAAAAKGVDLIWRAEGDLGTIRADPARLQQIVSNLLSNGVKFTPEGGAVTVTAERTPTALVLRISDTGIGIEPEFLPFVFDRFRQADASTTRAHTGVGLGLAIARHLVELHGGTITVESAGADRGATFTVRLPLP